MLHCMLPPVQKHFRERPWRSHSLSANPLSPNIHTHIFSRPICTGFGWEMLPWKTAKHFPLGDHFINFHSFFSWLCRGRHRVSKTVLDSKFHTSGFRIPATGFRIPIVSGLQIPRVVFRSPKPRILDSMGKNFLYSRFHEQKLPGFGGQIPLYGAIREIWCWSPLRLNGLSPKPKYRLWL